MRFRGHTRGGWWSNYTSQTIRVILYLLTYWQYVKKSIFAPNKIYMCTAFCGPKNWGPHSADWESVEGPEKADVKRRGFQRMRRHTGCTLGVLVYFQSICYLNNKCFVYKTGDEGKATHREHTQGVFYPNTKHLWALQIYNFVENWVHMFIYNC